MTLANECPECGEQSPFETSEIWENTDDNGIHWIHEDIYCECGTQVGGFSHPQV